MGSDVSLSKAVRANLLSLQNTASMMDKTQSRLATGNKVNSALDNPSNFFTASALNSRAADMSNLLDSMASGIKVIEAANNGITALTKNLESMQSTLRQARQDKTFQTKSFEVNDLSEISISGGQFGDAAVNISLADATVPGVKAELTTTAATAYLGPVSAPDSAAGAGARTMLDKTGIADTNTITVAGVTVTATTANLADDTTFAAAIQAALDGSAEAGKYTATAGTGSNAGKIIIESVDPAVEAAEVDVSAAGTVAVKGAAEFNYSDVPTSITVGGRTISTGATAAEFVAALKADGLANGYDVTYDADSGDIKLENLDFGGTAPVVAGIDPADVATTTVVAGAYTTEVAAAKHEFTVSYDGKTADITIGGVKAGANALDIKNWQDATLASVATQLEAKGINNVVGTFDEDGKFSLVAKTAEAKTLAVSGRDSVALFGTNGVNTGVAEKSELNATKTVDKFVELINRDHGGKVRASNDNGKLRIENLSTQELDIGVDLNGNDAPVASKIDGNSVRSNLSKQFNELRDQLDKLADDSSFNGINLLRGDKLKITFNESGTSSIDIQAKDKNGNVRGINASNLGVDSLVAEDLDTDEAIDAFLSKLSSALTELRSQASAFGSNLSSVENRQSFTKNMINTLETGAANLTLADTNEEAANLLALQTRQQLSSSALSMASQQDQAVLQLLR
ncbi:Flagellin FlgL [Devosia crocina]|uniref:Flagellin n=1 Tax=Devosia crocina TaxID=429728 RepID=A0A1I7N7T3_9HYPH|nr:flagellin [Devosia crocina]SFV30730.1 Flagellin FlgL [Devosia crocina]